MDVKYLNPFLTAAAEVIKAEAKLDINRGPITVHQGSLTTDEVTVLINLVGPDSGRGFTGTIPKYRYQFCFPNAWPDRHRIQ